MLDFFKKPAARSFLGVDIGTTGIRLVQLGRDGSNVKLENYAYLESEDYLNLIGNTNKLANNAILAHDKIVDDLAQVIKAPSPAITANKIAMSIPVASAFSSIITLPDMPEEEVERAINFEARKYIPIPLNEVTFGWSIIKKEEKKETAEPKDTFVSRAESGIKVLLVAIPRDISLAYSNVAEDLKLDLIALETESFSLARALAGRDKGVVAVVDIGSKTTSVTIAENGFVMVSHSVSSIGGMEITKVISHGFNIDLKRAESMKRDVGLSFSGQDKKVSEIMLPVVSVIISDIKKISETYVRTSRKEINKVIVTGGSANLPGLADYFSHELGVGVEIGDPWKNIVYNPTLTQRLKESGSHFAIAVGLALRGFES